MGAYPSMAVSLIEGLLDYDIAGSDKEETIARNVCAQTFVGKSLHILNRLNG